MITQTQKKYENCVTYPTECINCSEGQRTFCEVGSLEMKIGNCTYRKVKGHYECEKNGSGKAIWVEWEAI